MKQCTVKSTVEIDSAVICLSNTNVGDGDTVVVILKVVILMVVIQTVMWRLLAVVKGE